MDYSITEAWKSGDLSDIRTVAVNDGKVTKDPATGVLYIGPHVALQAALQDDVNIKTINGVSVLGSGNITVSADIAEYAAVNPATLDPNYAPALDWTFTSDGSSTNPNYSTHTGLAVVYTSTSGKNFPDLSAKTTFLPQHTTHDATAWGQKFLRGGTMNAWGNGDAIGEDMTLNVFGGLDAQGDEGVKFQRYVSRQGQSLQTTTITSVTRATINATTVSAITKSKDPQTVSVTSSIGVSVGQWVIIEGGAPSTSPFNFGEAVKVTAVGTGTITGVFSHDHSAGVPVRPATVLNVNYAYQWGQGRYCVLMNGSQYVTGTARGLGTVAVPSSAIEGVGTTWANNMVGGSSENPGAISFVQDDYSGAPYSPSTLRAWYPIASVSSTTGLSIYRRDQVGLGGYKGKQVAHAAYTIRPAARVMAVVGLDVVLDYNTFTWTPGQTVECAHSTSLDVSGCTWDLEYYTPGVVLRNGFHIYNTGTQDFEYGISVGPLGANGGGFTIGAGFLGEKWGLAVQGGSIFEPGAAAIQITAGAFYSGRIQWGTGTVGMEYDYTLDSLELNFGDGYGGKMISRRDGLGQRNIEYSGSLDLKQTDNYVKPKMGLEGFNSRHFYWQASDYAANNYLVFYAGLIGTEVPVWRYAVSGIELVNNTPATAGVNQASTGFNLACSIWDGAAAVEKVWKSRLVPVSNATNAKQTWRIERPTSNSSYPATVFDLDSDGVLTIGTQNFGSGVEPDKACSFDTTSITTGTKRTMTIPDKSGMLVVSLSGSADPTVSDLPDGITVLWFNTTSGVLRAYRRVGAAIIPST